MDKIRIEPKDLAAVATELRNQVSELRVVVARCPRSSVPPIDHAVAGVRRFVSLLAEAIDREAACLDLAVALYVDSDRLPHDPFG